MSIIRKLEEERLSLIMDIQREDFVSSKLIELIDQNQEIIESVKEYLEARESIQEEEAAYTKKQLDIFVNDIVLPILAQLNENLTGLLARMKNVAQTSQNTTQSQGKPRFSNVRKLPEGIYRVGPMLLLIM